MDKNNIIHFGPLQGFTNHIYRKLHLKYFGGVDRYYSPYLRFEKNKDPKKSSIKDLLPENNEGVPFVPQILGNDLELFLKYAKQIEDWGYKEMNWNLGCPYPMVTKRGFGSALVSKPDEVKEILEFVLPKINIKLSVKTRLGLVDENEIYDFIEMLNNFDISELTVHTRIAKQLYKGNASVESFVPLLSESNHKLIYNGDINNLQDFNKAKEIIKVENQEFMIGRGLLKNPFLASEIKGNILDSSIKNKALKNFHDELYSHYAEYLQLSHLLPTMKSQWEYLSHSFNNQRKVFKKIKKVKSINSYNEAVSDAFYVHGVI